ncbi:MAG: hypothetical protein COV48_15445 [Elusimicrobia bacterium CG11_big_fil_rev_8_21_14_0_20_64_6]|nr:MAG: hypothetical protein COV48_15445 [Elusimicrobia bacterium CG11_big_fil_rev_8_21_14_0_20_64_6]
MLASFSSEVKSYTDHEVRTRPVRCRRGEGLPAEGEGRRQKKAQENKPDGFAWSPGAPIARAAASASSVAARGRAPSAYERLASTPGKLAVLVILMTLGGIALSFTALHDGSSGSGSEGLGGIKSTIKFRAIRGRDSTRYGIGLDPGDSKKKGMNFALIKAGKMDLPMDGLDGGMDTDADGEEPMNYDEGQTTRAGTSGGGAAAAAVSKDAEANLIAGGGAAPKLNSSYGKIKFQGMKRVSGTAGFRGIKGRGGQRNQTIQTRGSSANSSGDAGGGTAGSRRSVLTPFRGNDLRTAGAEAGDKEATGSGTDGGGSGDGGGGSIDVGEIENMEESLPSIPALLAQAGSLRKEADKEEKKAKILAAGGHMPQAHYHYDKAEKKKKEAASLESQAAQQTEALQDQAEGLTGPAE